MSKVVEERAASSGAGTDESMASILIVDGVLLVVRAHATPVEAVQVARDRLEFLGAKILGVVLNDVRVTRSRYFYANYA